MNEKTAQLKPTFPSKKENYFKEHLQPWQQEGFTLEIKKFSKHDGSCSKRIVSKHIEILANIVIL